MSFFIVFITFALMKRLWIFHFSTLRNSKKEYVIFYLFSEGTLTHSDQCSLFIPQEKGKSAGEISNVKIMTVIPVTVIAGYLRMKIHPNTAQKMKFSIKDFIRKCDQIRSFLRIWSHLLVNSLMENFIFVHCKRVCDMTKRHSQCTIEVSTNNTAQSFGQFI